ncbi:hypothetical protein ACFP1Z_13565 [Streptomyces gamaensis]|uniref:Uncharacterized protein n=1 Tax=Streptomyces gamaensis TaxID=1763542 RepID=A0ABW0Z2D5_9ACTN
MKTTKTAKATRTTLTARKTANPRRTTLAHLTDTTALRVAEAPVHAEKLPAVTANPRRTTLMTAPATPSPQD